MTTIIRRDLKIPERMAWWAALLPVGVLLSPAWVLLAQTWPTGRPAALVDSLATVLIILLPLAWNRTVRGFLLTWLPIAPLAAAYALYPTIFHRLAGPEAWLSLFQTNAAEASELASYFWAPLLACSAAVLLYVVVTVTLPRMPVPRPMRLASVCGFAGLVILAPLMTRAFPVDCFRDAWQAAHMLAATGAPEAVAPIDRGKRPVELFVLVIGESARRQEFYELLPMTERLATRPNLVLFESAISQAAMTRFSVPMLLAGVTATLPGSAPNLLSYARAAGLHSVWLNGNDAEANYSIGADELLHVRGVPDRNLLPVIRQQIAKYPRLYLVVHTAGSHAPYATRYGLADQVFPVKGGHAFSATRAAYQNSIIATQRFLADTLAVLSEQKGEVFFCYVSDHAENLMDDERQLILHGFGARVEYDVPLVFWANDAYIASNSSGWRQLVANRRLPVSNQDVMATFKQAFGIAGETDNGLMGQYKRYERTVRFNTIVLPYSSLQ